MNTFSEKLREKKLKVTPQRLAIYSYLANSGAHPTVETIYNDIRADFPSMSIATVYKTVAALRDAGLVREFNISEDSNRYDAHMDEHAHIICTKCHCIEDYYGSFDMGEDICRMELASGFSIESRDMNFYGLCEKCRDK